MTRRRLTWLAIGAAVLGGAGFGAYRLYGRSASMAAAAAPVVPTATVVRAFDRIHRAP